jgi:hypothetical protein
MGQQVKSPVNTDTSQKMRHIIKKVNPGTFFKID